MCGGFDERTGMPFPKCDVGLVCIPSGGISIPGADNFCVSEAEVERRAAEEEERRREIAEAKARAEQEALRRAAEEKAREEREAREAAEREA